ncbi:MAG TPA: lysophospholipid acyltransferase family protein [Spirochaetota bacterium]|nr:lysophospholipid acyltransferase family protein [Spirochaetota bacterium]
MKDFKIRYIFYTLHGYLSLLVIILISLIIFIPVLIIHIFKKDIFLICTRFLVRLMFFLYCSPVNKYFKKKKIDSKRKIYIINHSSLIDGLLVYLIPENIKVMGNAIYGKLPILGIGFNFLGNISVKRGEQGNALDTYYLAKEYIENSYPVVIFPEGTRTRDGNIQKFQNGAFNLALDAKADIVPIVFDSWHFLPPHSFLIRERNIYIKILDPIRYEDIKDLTPKDINKLSKIKIIESLIEMKKNNKYNYDFSEIIKNLEKELITLKSPIKD